MSDQTPDSGAPQAAPGPESETGAGDTEVFAYAEFATGERNGGEIHGGSITGGGEIQGGIFTGGGEIPGGVIAGGGAERRSGKRVAWRTALGLGYAVLAAGTAFGVIAAKSPESVDVTAVNASAYAAPLGTVSAAAGAKPHSSSSPTNAATTAAATTAAATSASPTSTVTGSVSGGVHSGDLRFFLLPPPQGPSSVQGNPDGTTETLSDVVTNDYGGSSSVKTYLQQDGFKTACDRVYQDSTIGANVQIELLKFGSSSESSAWLSGASFNGGGYQSISVPGESGASGYSYAKSGNYVLIAFYRDGDTFFEVDVYGTQQVSAQALGQVVSAEHSRLANG